MRRKRIAFLLAGVAAAAAIGLLGGLMGEKSLSAEQPPESETVDEQPTCQVKAEAPTVLAGKEKRLEVPYISQEGSLPNGCEAVSATMLLRYWGYPLTAEEFVDQYLPCRRIEVKNGHWYGPDPGEFYAGDPRSARNGFGCFAPVITASLTQAVRGAYQVKNLTGSSLDTLCKYIDQGIPVAVWATIDMQPVKKYYRWKSFNGGETYQYPSGEHCLVLVGYDEDHYYFNDPLAKGVAAYEKAVVEQRYETLGKQAVAVVPLP
jgi:uncharacterized protein YvpB